MCMYLYMSAGVCRDQKRVSSALEVELWAVMSCPMWVLKLSTQFLLLLPSFLLGYIEVLC